MVDRKVDRKKRSPAERIRIDCVSVANHNLIRLLDKPDVGTLLVIRKYLF
jgi:hypothetical protein